MIFEDGDRLLFAGDSVTDMGSQNPVGENGDALGQGYVREVDSLLSAVYPEVRVRVTNAGISGNTSRDLLARFERDVVSLHPDWLSILIGVNDVWRQFDTPTLPNRAVSPEEYRENVENMLLAVKGKVKGVFLMTPYYMEPLAADAMRARMDEYGTICRELAEKHGATLIDLQAMFNRYFALRHSSSIAWDRIHPNRIGALLIAREFLSHTGFDYRHTPTLP